MAVKEVSDGDAMALNDEIVEMTATAISFA